MTAGDDGRDVQPCADVEYVDDDYRHIDANVDCGLHPNRPDADDVKKAAEDLSVGAGGATVVHDPATGDLTVAASPIGAVLAGVVRRNSATAAFADLDIDESAPATAEQIKRASSRAKPGLQGKARAIWIITGENTTQQAARGRINAQMAQTTGDASSAPVRTTRRAAAKADTADTRAAARGTEAAAGKQKPLSQRVTAKEAAKVRGILVDQIADAIKAGRFPNAPATDRERLAALVPTVLGFKTEKAMRAFVDGRETGDVVSKAGVKTLTRAVASHQVWARKAAAAAFGVMLEARS